MILFFDFQFLFLLPRLKLVNVSLATDWIPDYLQPDTQVALRVEMEKARSQSDVPGYIYTFEIRGTSVPSANNYSTATPIPTNEPNNVHSPEQPQIPNPPKQSNSKSGAQSTSSRGSTNGENSAGRRNRC